MAEIQGDNVVVNFDQESSSGDWPPEGAHLAKVMKCDAQTAKSDGSAMLYWEFEVVGDGQEKYRRVWTNTSLKANALWRMRDLVNALGVFPGAEGFKRSEMLGKMCRVFIKHEKYCKQHNVNGDHMDGSGMCQKATLMAKVDDYAPLGG